MDIICTKCHIPKPEESFSRAKKNKNGRKARCKACTTEDAAQYRATHLDKVRTIERASKKSHPKTLSADVLEKRALRLARATLVPRQCLSCTQQFAMPLFLVEAGRGFYCSRSCSLHRPRPPLAERFWNKVDQSRGPDACWPWQGTRLALPDFDYGVLSLHGKNVRAHRVSYMLAYGAIPDDIFVLHSCDVPHCVNPAHLFLGTPLDNMQDKVAKHRHTHGEHSHFAKLTESEVLTIIEQLQHDSSKGRHSRIAKQYGVRPRTISAIEHRRAWKHLTVPH